MEMRGWYGSSQERAGSEKCGVTNDSGGLGAARNQSKSFGFSGASGVDPGDRPWTGFTPGQEGSGSGGIGSRLIGKLLEQRAEVLSRYAVVMQRKEEYEAQLKRIDRELEEARTLLSEVLESENQGDE